MTEPTIKVKRLAYVRVGAPDLAKAEQFLDDFGLQVATRTDDAVFFRGTDVDAPCYVLSQGNGDVTAIAFEADSLQDLERIASVAGASKIEVLNEPSGGKVVRLIDPLGMTVEIVYGRASLEPLEPAPSHAFNMNGAAPRVGQLPAVLHGASRVRRIGHLVLESGDPESVFAWYHQHLGLKVSDAVRLPDGSPQMVFSRVDQGDAYVDHHVVGFQFALDEGIRVQHIAFEVGNIDDLMSGHEYLKRRKRKHVWGIGRHLLGGQIFDYWKSPFDVIHEHWTDTDLLNDTHESQNFSIAEMKDYWGPAPSPGFLIAKWNFKVFKNIFRLLKARLKSTAE